MILRSKAKLQLPVTSWIALKSSTHLSFSIFISSSLAKQPHDSVAIVLVDDVVTIVLVAVVEVIVVVFVVVEVVVVVIVVVVVVKDVVVKVFVVEVVIVRVVEVLLVFNVLGLVGTLMIGVEVEASVFDVANPPASPTISTDSAEAATRAMTAMLLQVIEKNKSHSTDNLFFVQNLCLFDKRKLLKVLSMIGFLYTINLPLNVSRNTSVHSFTILLLCFHDIKSCRTDQ